MKANCTFLNRGILALLLFVIFFSVKLNAQYCTPSNIGSFNTNYISNVALGTINNSSVGSTGAFVDYTSVTPTDITAGQTVSGTVTVTINGWNTNTNTVAVWFNFNEIDDDFDDAGERFLFTFTDTNNVGGQKNITVPISIPIPATAQNGNARMRVGIRTGANTNFTSCDYNYAAGEIEDYMVNFVGGVDPGDLPPNFCETVNIGSYNTLYISNVNLGPINNSTSGTTGGFSSYTTFSSDNIPVGQTLTGTISVTLNGWNTNRNTVAVWLNLNESSDDDYEDVGERFLFTFRDTNNVGGTKVVDVPISITIPSSADEALSKIRIGVRGGTNTTFTSCDFGFTNGEIEDYVIYVGGAPNGPDTDGDGIVDIADLDSDNDGILDTDEGLVFTTVTTPIPVVYDSDAIVAGVASGRLITMGCFDEFTVDYDIVPSVGGIINLSSPPDGSILNFNNGGLPNQRYEVTYTFSEVVDVRLALWGNAPTEAVTFITPYDNIIPGFESTILNPGPPVVWHNRNRPIGAGDVTYFRV